MGIWMHTIRYVVDGHVNFAFSDLAFPSSEMVSGQEPWADYDLLEAAIGVRDQGWAPEIPENAPKLIAKIMKACFTLDRDKRPYFYQILDMFP